MARCSLHQYLMRLFRGPLKDPGHGRVLINANVVTDGTIVLRDLKKIRSAQWLVVRNGHGGRVAGGRDAGNFPFRDG